jgi:hypothetical protein
MNLNTLVSTLTNRLNELGKNKDDPTVIVNEVKLVGAYASSTLMKDTPMADIVVITKDPPNTNTLATLYDVLMKTAADTNVSFDAESTEITVQAHDYGARVMVTWLGAWSASKKIVIMVHEEDKVVEEKEEIKVTPQPSGPAMSTTKTSTTTTTTTITTTTTTTPPTVESTEQAESTPIDLNVTPNVDMPQVTHVDGPYTDGVPEGAIVKQEPTSKAIMSPTENLEGVNIAACQQALLSIRQMMWFKDHTMLPNIRNVMRLLMDFRSRVPGFQSLSPWALEVIIVNALRGTSPSSSISQSVRSLFAYIASGVLLPGVELIDPCEQEPVHILRMLTDDQRLKVTAIAQEVIREIAYGKWERIVGV